MAVKFPFVKQKDAMQCGVAALAAICQHYGKPVSLNWLSGFCTPTREGVSLLGLCNTARELGFEANAVKCTVDALSQLDMPMIIHWNRRHFVVLYRIKNGKRFYISDPAKGRCVLSRAEFEEKWVSMISKDEEKGIALLLTPRTEFFDGNFSNTSEKRSFKFLAGYLRQYRSIFLQIAFALLTTSILQLVMPFMTQAIVDIGIARRSIGFIWMILIGELLIVAGRTSADFLRRWLLLHVSMRINLSLVSDFLIKLLKLPMSYFDTKMTGDLLQRMSDHGRVQAFLSNEVLSMLFSIVTIAVLGAVLAIYNWIIFLIFFVGSIIFLTWTSVFLHRRRVLDYELFQVQSKSQNKTYQFLTSIQEIKLQDCCKRRRWEWEDVQAELFDVQMKSTKLQQTQESGAVFINEIVNILITVVAAGGVIAGALSFGEMLAIQFIVGQLSGPVGSLSGFMYTIQDVKISLERINEIHESQNEQDAKHTQDEQDVKSHVSVLPDISPLRGEISISNLNFRYDKFNPKLTLEDITFKIPSGKVTAIVGASGSGKTTLIKILLGFYPYEAGDILAEGIALPTCNIELWRQRCGVVMQEGVIFSESIARNIAVNDKDIDYNRLAQAAATACIDTFIASLPMGYDTVIGPEGVGLSQGQKQRILIARAVYRDPDFLFLDEATNALDAKNERQIVENLADFFRGRTVVIVAHRLSTVCDADNIIVLEQGRVVEQGTHTSLTEARGAYYTLVKNQLELGM